MRSYKYTNRLLLYLAISNILMFIPAIWGVWFSLSFFLAAQGEGYQILFTILASSVLWFLILTLSTWAFLKRWRWVLYFYLVYLTRMIPVCVATLIQYWQQNNFLNFLGSTISAASYIFVWLLGLITLIVMLIETDYGSLANKYRVLWRRYKK